MLLRVSFVGRLALSGRVEQRADKGLLALPESQTLLGARI